MAEIGRRTVGRTHTVSVDADPSGVVAPQGSIALRDDGTVYTNTDGTGTGWQQTYGDVRGFVDVTTGIAGAIAAEEGATLAGDIWESGNGTTSAAYGKFVEGENGLLLPMRFVTSPNEAIAIIETDPDAVSGMTSDLNGGAIDYNSTVAGKCAIQSSGGVTTLRYLQDSARSRAEVAITNWHIDSSGTGYRADISLYDGTNFVGIRVDSTLNGGNITAIHNSTTDTGIAMALAQTRSLRIVLDTGGEIAIFIDDSQLPDYYVTGLTAGVSAAAAQLLVASHLQTDNTTQSFDELYIGTVT